MVKSLLVSVLAITCGLTGLTQLPHVPHAHEAAHTPHTQHEHAQHEEVDPYQTHRFKLVYHVHTEHHGEHTSHAHAHTYNSAATYAHAEIARALNAVGGAQYFFDNDALGAPDPTVADLTRQIDAKQAEIDKILEEKEQIQSDIEDIQQEGATLRSAIALIEANIQQTNLTITEKEQEIEQTQLEIERAEEEIAAHTSKMEQQKLILSELIRTMYQSDRVSTIEILLANDSFSDFLDDQQAVSQLESRTQQTFQEVKSAKEVLEEQKITLETKERNLEQLTEQLKGEKQLLEQEQAGKESLLAQTNADESQYQELLAQANNAREQANREIQSAEAQIRAALAAAAARNTNDTPSGSTSPAPNVPPQDGPVARLSWPVQPIHGISARFLDPNYRAFLGFEHKAIDIPTPHGTPLRAAADGTVVRAYDSGNTNYSYVLILHSGGLSTAYGHMSSIGVQNGQQISRGQVIGLSGGTPGTRGAGISTGPHLHFETRLNGTLVDPEQYLP